MLQVEIIDNLLQIHDWPRIRSLLGLSVEEERIVHEHLTNCNDQIKQENLQLQKMQEKQLRALMRIDNSEPMAHRAPHQLVFRKSSRRSTRTLKKCIESDYLLCKARELFAARRFLSRRGLDPRHAGEWSSDLMVHNGSIKTLVWKEDRVTDPQKFQADSLAPSMESENYQRLQSKVRFINEIGSPRTMDLLDWRIRGGCAPSVGSTVATVQPSLNDMASPFNTQACGVVRLRIGSQRAALIRDLGELPEWKEELRQNSNDTRICRQFRLREFDGSSYCVAEPSSVATEDGLVQELPGSPIRRRIGGLWSYKSIGNSPTTKSASGMLPKKNTEETQVQDQEQAKTAMTESVVDTPTAPNSCQSPRSSAAEQRTQTISLHQGQNPVSLLYSNMTFGGSFSTSSPSKSVYGVDYGPQYSPITPPSSSTLAQEDSPLNKSFSPFLDNNLDNRCLWPADKKGGNNRYGFSFNEKTHEQKDEWIEKLAAEPGETTRDHEGKMPNMTNNVTHRVVPEAHISEAQESTSTAPEPNKSKTRNGSASGLHKASRKKITRSARGRLDRSAKRSQN